MIKPEFENTIRFAGRMVAPPDHQQYFPPKPIKSQSNDEWGRNWEITGLYLGTDKTLKEIGANFHPRLTGERVRQIILKNLGRLYRSSDKQTNAEFPWESLETKKPLSIASRRKRSLASRGIAVNAEELVKKRLSAGEIQTALNATSQQLVTVRTTLHGWGSELPYKQPASAPRYRENLALLLAGTLPYDEAQKIIDQVTRSTLEKSSTEGKRNFLSVTKLAQMSGLFMDFRKVSILAEELKTNQIPTGSVDFLISKKPGGIIYTHHYYFIPFCYEERAKEILQGLLAT